VTLNAKGCKFVSMDFYSESLFHLIESGANSQTTFKNIVVSVVRSFALPVGANPLVDAPSAKYVVVTSLEI